MTCSFNNVNCMCQFCEKQCNNGFNCYECNHEGKAIHDICLCTGFEGDLDAYIQSSMRISKGE